MKTIKVSLLLLAAALLNHCGSPNTTAGITTSYYSANGYCYASGGTIVSSTYCSGTTSTGYTLSGSNCVNSVGTVVSISYCTATGTTGYTLSNGYCINATGQIVASSYCSNIGGGAVQCSGIYYTQTYYGMEPITCSGTSCSGKTLFNAYGAPVVCL